MTDSRRAAGLAEISVHVVIQRLREAGHVQSSQSWKSVPGSVRLIHGYRSKQLDPCHVRIRREGLNPEHYHRLYALALTNSGYTVAPDSDADGPYLIVTKETP